MAIVNSQEWADYWKKSAHLRQKILHGQPLEHITEQDIYDFVEFAIRQRGFDEHSAVAISADAATDAMDHLRELSACLNATIQAETKEGPDILKMLGDPSGGLQVMEDPLTEDEASPGGRLHSGTPSPDVSQQAVNNNGEPPKADSVQKFMQKQKMCEYHNLLTHFIALLVGLSNQFVGKEKPEKKKMLAPCVHAINQWLFERRVFCCLAGSPFTFMGLQLPMFQADDNYSQIVNIHLEDCIFFSSRTRAPYLIVFETVNMDEEYADDQNPPDFHTRGWPSSCVSEKYYKPSTHKPDRIPIAQCVLNEFKQFAHLEQNRNIHTLADAVSSTPEAVYNEGYKESTRKKKHVGDNSHQSDAERKREEIWGESKKGISSFLIFLSKFNFLSWADKQKRIRDASPYGGCVSWGLRCAVVKGGDDVRQDLLCCQLIRQFKAIFEAADLPLFLRPYEILPTSSSSGFMEFLTDTDSIDGIKKKIGDQPFSEFFAEAFGDNLIEAKQNFIESSAAYSLVSYFLQLRDRHNGNLMLDRQGHIIHLDFGFMISNSPGNVNWETSAFKLTQETLDVMGGEHSEQFEYFRTLIIRGFLEARKHFEKIMLLVNMQMEGSKMGCFIAGAEAIQKSMTERFLINITEEAC